MNRGYPVIAILVMIAFWVAAIYIPLDTLYAQDDGTKDPISYIGAKKCKKCHALKKYGAQYKHWETTQHAQAYETLLSDEAIAIAKEKGLEKLPHEAPECLECHTTGFGVAEELRDAGLTLEEGVSCEVCHGAGSAYYTKKVMQAISDGELDGATVGLTTPNDEKMCLNCHNDKSPTFKPFVFEERRKKIAHPALEAAAE